MNTVIDAGNTRIKFAQFNDQGEIILPVKFLDKVQDLSPLDNHNVIISSVLNDDETKKITTLLPNAHLFSSNSLLPIHNDYNTPESLGKDRLANVVGAHSVYQKEHILIIDAGTCIKYDVIVNGHYQGGAISPGISMRYKALHTFTGKLPLLTAEKNSSLIGKNTDESIHSGVMKGVEAEIHQIIKEYKAIFKNLLVVYTGGDIDYLCEMNFSKKNNIFANPNLTLIGLNEILKLNAKAP